MPEEEKRVLRTERGYLPKKRRPRFSRPLRDAYGHLAGWEPLDVERDMVRAMVAAGIPQPQICACLDVSESTLRKHCGHDIATGATMANHKVAESLFWMATEGPIQQRLPAAIFWMKTRGGWKEIQYIEQLRPPSEMSDDELNTAIALARSGRRPRNSGGRVVQLVTDRTRETKSG
jgi:hypothetical protein